RHAGAIQDVRDLREVGPGSSMNQAFIRRVAGGLARLPQQVTLVLDDLDEIHEPRVMKDLSMLLRCQPEQLRLVLVARTDPVLPLHRMRAAGDLTEIRAADLQFTAAEATSCCPITACSSTTVSCGCCWTGPRAGRPACGWPRSS